MPSIPIEYYLGISVILFFLGLVTILARKNLVYVLLGVELILNAASLNFVVFSRYGGNLHGQIVSIFIIILAAAEAAVALAIVLNIYNNFKNVDIDTPSELKD
jgi:NADH-quinone oxidoreductase subunit K